MIYVILQKNYPHYQNLCLLYLLHATTYNWLFRKPLVDLVIFLIKLDDCTVLSFCHFCTKQVEILPALFKKSLTHLHVIISFQLMGDTTHVMLLIPLSNRKDFYLVLNSGNWHTAPWHHETAVDTKFWCYTGVGATRGILSQWNSLSNRYSESKNFGQSNKI